MKASPLKKTVISLQFQVAIDQKAGKLHNFDITVNLHISSLKQKIDRLQLDINVRKKSKDVSSSYKKNKNIKLS